MAIDIVRDVAGLTGTKLACGAGVCGACTVEVDGSMVTSCVLPAQALDGVDVRTIEGMADSPSTPHPVQKAFMAADGLQCGFCTPGFVMGSIQFYRRWNEQNRPGTPTKEEIGAALSGHLCRCGAHLGIIEAVQRACAGEFDGDRVLHPARVEAGDKVSGRATYTVDVRLEGQLEGYILRSTQAHAVVEAIDLGPARDVDGVVATVHLLEQGDPIVRYVGQPIAAVAATSRHVAERAAHAAEIRYRPLPFVIDMDQALAGTPTAYEGAPSDPPNSSEGPVPPGRWNGNIRQVRGSRLLSVRPRKAEKLIDQAATDPDLELVSGTYRTADQIHTALEPHAAVARWPSRDVLEVFASTQSVDLLTTELSEGYDLARENVRVSAEHIGGAFGAKQGLQEVTRAAVELSRAADGVPVRVVNDRREEMSCGGHRPGARVDIDLVAGRDGSPRALRVDAIGSAGVAVNSTIAVLSRLFYPGIPKKLVDRDVVTNLPPGKPFRGPYGPPFFLAMEASVDDMAHRVGLDPIALRRQWDPNELRGALYDWAEGLEVWTSRGPVAADAGRFRRGVGVAIGGWVNMFYAGTEVEVSVSEYGIEATTTVQDMGNGTRSVLAQAVAETLGVARSDVRAAVGRTTEFRGPTSSGSRTTNAVFMAATRAAQGVRSALTRAAKNQLRLLDVRDAPGGVEHAEGRLTWMELAARTGPVSARGKRGANHPLDVLGRIPTGKLAVNFARPNTAAVYLCEVVVDARLGRVRAKKFWAGIAAGRIVAPLLARRQIEGGIIQGLGYCLYEERNVDPATGTVMNLGLEEYRIPGIADAPDVEIHLHEDGFQKLAGHAAGLAELATVPVAAAMSNAIHHATGRRFRELPMRPARILEGLS